MSGPRYDEIDRIAAEATDDLRRLCAVWLGEGPAALDAAVRGDPAFSFAVFDGRSGSTGAVRLLAMRREAPGVILAFGRAATGERHVVASGLGTYQGFILVAEPALSAVAVSSAVTAWSPTEAPDAALATDFAWRFDVGVSAMVEEPASFATLPADFEPGRHDVSVFGPALLAALDGAEAVLAGLRGYSEGLRDVTAQRWDCGLRGNDPDMVGIYAVDCQRDDLDLGFAFRREQTGGNWTWEQELAHFEDYARTNAEADCRSLVGRFRGVAFAES
jgi:hypothetical protein